MSRVPDWKPLVRLSYGTRTAAVCKDEKDGSLWLSTDHERGGETELEGYRPLEGYGPVQRQLDGSSLIDGRVPPRAHRVEVRATVSHPCSSSRQPTPRMSTQ
jgi:hypothetical protein